VQEVVPEERGGLGARPAALSCTGLVKRYGQATAVDGIDLVVERGRVVGLVGPNGSGKTTTLRLCAGIAPPDEGSVLVAGLPQGRPAARSRVGYVPDEPTGLDELTVGEYLELVRALYRAGPAYTPRAQTLLAAFRLDGRQRALLGSLSHGARRATAVTRPPPPSIRRRSWPFATPSGRLRSAAPASSSPPRTCPSRSGRATRS
jgi:ABC-type multidrug transport system ATPase subunit